MSSPSSTPTAAPYDKSLMPTRPSNHLVWAILSLLFFLPFAVASIIYSVKVNKLWESGDIFGAQRASKRALIFAGSAVAVSVVLIGGLLLTGGTQQ